jgi:hypothetical protein
MEDSKSHPDEPQSGGKNVVGRQETPSSPLQLVERLLSPGIIQACDRGTFEQLLGLVAKELHPRGVLENELCYTIAMLLLQKHRLKIEVSDITIQDPPIDRTLQAEREDWARRLKQYDRENLIAINQALLTTAEDEEQKKQLKEKLQALKAERDGSSIPEKAPRPPSRESLLELLALHEKIDCAIDAALKRLWRLQGRRSYSIRRDRMRSRSGHGFQVREPAWLRPECAETFFDVWTSD